MKPAPATRREARAFIREQLIRFNLVEGTMFRGQLREMARELRASIAEQRKVLARIQSMRRIVRPARAR